MVTWEVKNIDDRDGIDIFVECNDNFLSEANYGPGRYFPGGPRCVFNGNDIPCYVNASPKGSITCDILADMLMWIDDKGVYPREKMAQHLYYFLMDMDHVWRFHSFHT